MTIIALHIKCRLNKNYLLFFSVFADRVKSLIGWLLLFLSTNLELFSQAPLRFEISRANLLKHTNKHKELKGNRTY